MNNEKKIKQIISCGGTLEEAAAKFGVCTRTICNWLKASYKSEKCYRNLLEKARLNKLEKRRAERMAAKEKAAKEEKEAEEDRASEKKAQKKLLLKMQAELAAKLKDIRQTVTALHCSEKPVVVVTETSYLLEAGSEGIWCVEAPIYMPTFCFTELDLQCEAGNEKAIEVATLNSFFKIIKPFKPKKEWLYKNVSTKKKRSKGVVAVCCELIARGKTVVLLTNSTEIKCLANFQQVGFIVKKL